MTEAKHSIKISGLAHRLINDKLLTSEVAERAYSQAMSQRTHFVTYLVEHNILDSQQIAYAASQEFGVPLIDINVIDLDQAPISLVEEKLIRTHHSLPLFRRGNRLFLGVSDPTNIAGLDEIKFHTGLTTEAIVVEEDKLNRYIEAAMDAAETTMEELMDADLDNLDVSINNDDAQNEGEMDIDDAPVVRFVNKILLDAIKLGASDIHFEPYEKSFRVRFRQDGMLNEVASPPINISPKANCSLKSNVPHEHC